MIATRPACFFTLVVALLGLGGLQATHAQRASRTSIDDRRANHGLNQLRSRASVNPAFVASDNSETGGIREVIDSKYLKRYREWKDEFLSTEIGRAQWDLYSHHSHLLLTITVAAGNAQGAGSGKYKWNEAGELVASTITLGPDIDGGFPSDIYYPVMNALEPYLETKALSGNVLAATKLAHELGHIMKIGVTPQALYRLQLRLVPMYNKIFLSNGYNVEDPRLVELAKQMGGNPVEIWEDREYWGEANAMLFLRDRVAQERFHCKLFNRIKRTVEEYAKPYEERFTEIAKSQGVIYSCSWK
jgi:hypothetical protein